MGEFWDLTPRETHAVFKAGEWRLEREHRGQVCLAWHVAALSRAKRLPPLKRLLGGGTTKVLTGDELEQRRREHEELKRRIHIGH